MIIANAPERSIQSKTDDKLERSRFIERLAAALVNPSTKKSTGVVVGITGPWGSGKSSILNLLKEELKDRYPEALVVQFDPWLVSGRNDLIAEFLGELIGTINSDEKRFAKFKKLGGTIAQYGAQLAPIGNAVAPGLGSIFASGFGAAVKAFSEKESLSALRSRLIKELSEIAAPLVVLIDELDRIDDDEVRTVAQLVRSVADFSGISYVLAYDPERVMQALGAGAQETERLDRGRAYLEKIVQLQIPIPVTFDDEIIRLLTEDLKGLSSDLSLPDGFEGNARFHDLVQLLASDVISTLRDIRRLVGTFHVLAGMLYGEVDWVDLLAYSALLIKSPATVARMRRDPDEFLDDPQTQRAMMSRMLGEKKTSDDRLQQLIPPSEFNHCTKSLLQFLFPSLSDDHAHKQIYADPFHERRPLLNVLRLGLLPGAYSRDAIRHLFLSPTNEIKIALKKTYDSDAIDALTDRISDLYSEVSPAHLLPFWRGVAAFAAKPDYRWMATYSSMNEKIRNLTSVLEQAVGRDENYRGAARQIFMSLCKDGESELIAYWLRAHFFSHGLHGCDKRSSRAWFLDVAETEQSARALVQRWKDAHLAGALLPSRWDLQPVYTMLDMGAWDESCRNALDASLENDKALVGFTLMLYGGAYTIDRATIAKMCTLERYLKRAESYLGTKGSDDESVLASLKKAAHGWP